MNLDYGANNKFQSGHVPLIIDTYRKRDCCALIVERLRRCQAVCALRSQRIMGGVQNLIICIKMAWSEHLTESDCGDEYSLNAL